MNETLCWKFRVKLGMDKYIQRSNKGDWCLTLRGTRLYDTQTFKQEKIIENPITSDSALAIKRTWEISDSYNGSPYTCITSKALKSKLTESRKDQFSITIELVYTAGIGFCLFKWHIDFTSTSWFWAIHIQLLGSSSHNV